MAHFKRFDPKEKGMYWWAMMYTENMRSDWKENIAHILQIPFSYCIHNYDNSYSDGSSRKEHVHILVRFQNPTTGKNALNLFLQLNDDNKNAIPNNEIEKVSNVVYAYNYLIHDTPEARKSGKHLYSKSDRICGNNFDIGSYEQLTLLEAENISNDLCDLICEKGFTNFMQFYKYIRSDPELEGDRKDKLVMLKRHSGLYERLCRGNYLEKQDIRQQEKDRVYFEAQEARTSYFKEKK